MTDRKVLQKIKEFLEINVVPKIKLMRPQDKAVEQYELVNPSVFEGYIPPTGYLPAGTENNMPCILVGMETGEDSANSAVLNIRLSFAVFNPGKYGGASGLIPDFSGYADLLNLMTATKLSLFSKIKLSDDVTAEKPVQWGMYDEQPYPYWYGWMTFSVPIAPVEYNAEIEILYD